jgi:hypothetical protein
MKKKKISPILNAKKSKNNNKMIDFYLLVRMTILILLFKITMKPTEQAIQLMFYSTHNKKYIFSFLGINTIIALKILPENLQLTDIKFAATNGIDYLYPDSYKKGNSIKDLIKFVNANSKLIFVNMELTFSNELKLYMHDEIEATYYFPQKIDYTKSINRLLKMYNYNSSSIISKLTDNIDTYLTFKQPDILENKYLNFDEYLNTENIKPQQRI